MSIVGDFTIPAEAFALDQALAAVPEMEVEADRLASHSPKEVFPFLWATGGDADRFLEALRDDHSVVDTNVADETETDVLYRLEWSESFCELVHDMVDHHAAIVDAKAQGDHWDLRLRFSREEMVSAFQRHFHEQGHDFEVAQLYHPQAPRQRAFGLTVEQHEALVVAVEEGYFQVPRRTSTETLSDSLGISANACSERIRRGIERMVQSGLLVHEDEQ